MVRTRVAPSPTGDPHVGTAYVALFNYCFARRHGGRFVLRIEDTDRKRSHPRSEEMILRSLRWLRLDWDEGPDVGGDYGPYRQSDRLALYREHVQALFDAGHAFRCFCPAERLAGLRSTHRAQDRPILGYDGYCLRVSAREAASRAGAGEPYVVRMKVPGDGVCIVRDLLRGDIPFAWEQVDMQVLLKSDGSPTYHLANVVDDRLMGITHVLRGEEWLASTPKHLLLYSYFGWPPPEFCHLPLLRNPDQSKLSKRKNPTSVLFYERMGYLPEALLNYLGRMAWSMPEDREKFSLAEMVAAFDLGRISLGGPVFDVEKLSWLNGRWIREDLSLEEYAERVHRWALNPDYLMRIAPLTQQRVERLSDLEPLAGFFFRGLLDPSPADLVLGPLERQRIVLFFDAVVQRFDSAVDWDRSVAQAAVRAAAAELGIDLRDALKALYVALTGKAAGVPLFDAMEILGKDLCRARIQQALHLVAG